MAKIAYLFGVSEYESFPRLPAAVNDVGAMEDVLSDKNIGDFNQVKVFRDLDFAQTRKEMQALFARREQGDLVLLYFAGHGMTDELGQFYFIMRDTDVDGTRFSKANAIESRYVLGLMEDCPSQQVVVILDCCNGGAFTPRGNADEIDFKSQLGGRGRVVLTASATNNYAYEKKGETLAIYTRYLVQGLKTGAAARDGKNCISVADLHAYVKAELKIEAPAMTPKRYVIKDAGEEIVLAQVAVPDPERAYRKLVKEKCVKTGSVLPAGRRILDQERDRLAAFGLTVDRADAIEAEALEPYRKRRENQAIYRETLQEILALDRTQQIHAFEEVIELEDRLKLSIEDLKAIRQDVLGSETLPQMQTVVQPATPKSKPTASALQNLQEDLGGGIFVDLVAIPGGSFLMGAAKGEEGASDDEYPQHQVTIAPFWMGKFTVTQAQWKTIAKLKKIKCDLKPDPSNFKGADRPVENVSWDESIEFCDRLSAKTGKRYGLPSEAQWEYACRSGTTAPFHFGETISTDLANYAGNRGETTPVGTFSPNAFGLYDMHGNVWEWCADPWHNSYEGAPIDGSVWQKNGNEKLRLLRGGSWSDCPTNCRSADRGRNDRDDRNDFIGFRILLFSPQDS